MEAGDGGGEGLMLECYATKRRHRLECDKPLHRAWVSKWQLFPLRRSTRVSFFVSIHIRFLVFIHISDT